METATIRVPDMHCDHCVAAVEGALQPMDGVEDARVNLADTTVTVTLDPARVSRDQVVVAIEDQGYDVAD